MADLSTLRTMLRTLMAIESDDPAFPVPVLTEALNQATDALVNEIHLANPDYLSVAVTLVPDTAGGRVYSLATQSTPVTDFYRWLEIRYTDVDGTELDEAEQRAFTNAGEGYFAITGTDEAAVLRTSQQSDSKDLYFRYGFWPVQMVGETTTPDGIPLRFHDVIPLEALYVFGYGGEQGMPRDLAGRWMTRRGQLMTHIGSRGVAVARTRIVDQP